MEELYAMDLPLGSTLRERYVWLFYILLAEMPGFARARLTYNRCMCIIYWEWILIHWNELHKFHKFPVLHQKLWLRTLLIDQYEMVLFVANFHASPKRSAILFDCQSQNPDNFGTSLRPLCPTRWTTREKSMNSLLINYDMLFSKH
jgi:hypothetical protein